MISRITVKQLMLGKHIVCYVQNRKLSIRFVLQYFTHAATDEITCRWNKELQAFPFPIRNKVISNNTYNFSRTRIINNTLQPTCLMTLYH